MFSRDKTALLVIAALFLGSRGGGGKPVPTALHVQAFPNVGFAYTGQSLPGIKSLSLYTFATLNSLGTMWCM